MVAGSYEYAGCLPHAKCSYGITGNCCGCRYHELFFMIDTCQAESMFQKFYSPNILAVASSRVGEDSLSVSTALQRFCLHSHSVEVTFSALM